MSLATLQLGSNVKVEKSVDSLGGSRVFDSAIYDLTIEMAYMIKSKNGALGVSLVLTNNDNPKQKLNLTGAFNSIYISNAKGDLTYTDKQTGDLRPLPGYQEVNAIALLACGKELYQLETEQKTIKVYDAVAKGEVNKEMPVLMDLLGQKISAGVLKVISNKQVQAGDKWIDDPTGATRDSNEVDKWFRAEDGLTLAEIEAQATESVFRGQWAEKNNGNPRDKSKKPTGAPVAGAPAAATTSMFSNT